MVQLNEFQELVQEIHRNNCTKQLINTYLIYRAMSCSCRTAADLTHYMKGLRCR